MSVCENKLKSLFLLFSFQQTHLNYLLILMVKKGVTLLMLNCSDVIPHWTLIFLFVWTDVIFKDYFHTNILTCRVTSGHISRVGNHDGFGQGTEICGKIFWYLTNLYEIHPALHRIKYTVIIFCTGLVGHQDQEVPHIIACVLDGNINDLCFQGGKGPKLLITIILGCQG